MTSISPLLSKTDAMFNGERLTLARQRRMLSGLKLADKAGVTAVTISKIENGHLPEDVVDKLASALKYPREVSLSSFAGGIGR